MAIFTEIQLESYGELIGFGRGRLLKFLDSYVKFIQNDYPAIVDFFSGNSDFLDSEHTRKLEGLKETSDDLSNAIIINGFIFDNYLHWEITDYLEDLKVELLRITKTAKFLRSSKTNFNFTNRLEVPRGLLQNQTLEDIAHRVERDADSENSWIDIAFRNDLSELDYNLEDGRSIIVGFQISSRNYSIRSVVDIIIGERILGKDIQRKIEFINDDLKVLGYHETAQQSVEILVNLDRGDVPEFKSFGRSQFVGTSTKAVGIATLVREMYTVFSSDDSLTRFSVKEYRQEGSDAFLKFEVSTRLGETVTQATAL